MEKRATLSQGVWASPWRFVPSLYFQQGVPVVLVQQFSVIFFKRMGISNDRIGLWTSLIAWPWILKLFWSPLVELTWTKRNWVLAMQLSLSLAFVMLAATVRSSNFLPLSLSVFFLIAILSATHDVALDGYYILALAPKRQAFFVGIRSTFFRLAMVFCSGALVICAGQWEKSGLPVAESWKRAIWIGAFVYAMLAAYESWAMPRLSRSSDPVSGSSHVSARGVLETFRSFFAQPGIFRIISFFLLYRFSEAMLTKVSGLFLLDKHVAGGLEFSTVQVGEILGNVGVASLVVGGILGGFIVSKFGLRRCFWPIAITMNLPNFLYLWAARAQIGPVAMGGVTAVEQFSYGFGMAPYLIYAMEIAGRSRFKTSHYAILSGFIALGAMIAGIASGYLQVHLGYFGLFVVICLSSIPGMVLLKFIPH